MPRSVVLLVTAIALGLALGANVWMMGKIIHNSDAQPLPTSNNQNSSTNTKQKRPAATLDKSAQPSLNAQDPTASQPSPEIISKITEPSPGLDTDQTDEPIAEKQNQAALKQTNPAPIPTDRPEPGTKPAMSSEKEPITDQYSYSQVIQTWNIRPYQTGCVATLTADGKSKSVDPFKPDYLALYIYQESGQRINSGVPSWYGFVAPGRGEMSASLLSTHGEHIRGVTGRTGLSWDDLASYGQKDMELRLTQCDLEGNCRTRVGSFDLSAINSVATETFNCANSSQSQ